jgi:hypothetical protein
LHALLLGAAALVGWPWWCGALAWLAILAHALGRGPGATPRRILLAADGACQVPELDARWRAPGSRTRLAAYWISLSLGEGRDRLDILLWIDQLDSVSWANLRARLLRRGVAGTIRAAAAQSTDRTDLR